eukprot:3184094-Pleurochrysis_carterae.AAC.1
MNLHAAAERPTKNDIRNIKAEVRVLVCIAPYLAYDGHQNARGPSAAAIPRFSLWMPEKEQTNKLSDPAVGKASV